MYFRQIWNKSRSWLALLQYVAFNMNKKNIMVVTSRKQSIFNITNDFLFCFIQDFFRVYEIQGFRIFFPLAMVCNHREISTFVIYFKKASALYQLGRVTLIGFKVYKCHPCPRWKAAAARKLVHCVCIQCTWDTCSETESSQDIYWSTIRLSTVLFLVLIELEAKWGQKETIKWLQLRSMINNVFFTQQKAE